MIKHNNKSKNQNMLVKYLKKILNDLPNDMPIIIPVIDEDNANHIYGFRYVRTAGELACYSEQDREVLCLNAAADGQDIADQVYFSGQDVSVNKILFGVSKYEKKRIIKRYEKWKNWKKRNDNDRLYQLLVLFGLRHSPSFEAIYR